MPHREDFLAALVALWGTEHLARGRVVPWDALEERLEIDLTGRSEAPSTVRFLERETDGPKSVRAWLDAIADEGATRLGLVPADIEHTAPDGGNGERGLRLYVRTDEDRVVYEAAVRRSRETTVEARDILAFLEAQPDPEALRISLLWEDAHNLHITDGTDWDRFVAALRPEHDDDLMGAFERCVHNVQFHQGEAEAWERFTEEHTDPRRLWRLEFVRSGSLLGPVPPLEVAAQATRLEEALAKLRAYATEIGQERWALWFEQALDTLRQGPLPSWVDRTFHGAALDDAALRLIAASVQANVFGGMGSWNDLNPPDPEPYERLSEALFVQLGPSLVTAVNATTRRLEAPRR